MSEAVQHDKYWAPRRVLSTGDRPAAIRDTRPTETEKGVVDAKTFDAIEADEMFESLNHAGTHVGKCVLYRSLAHPVTDPEIIREKQEAVRELGSNPELCDSLQRFIDEMGRGEQALYDLLYGTFTGGLAVDNSRIARTGWNSAAMGTTSSSTAPVSWWIRLRQSRLFPNRK